MEVTDGKLSWSAEIDFEQVEAAKAALEQYFAEIGMSAEDAGKAADDAMKALSDAVSGVADEAAVEAEGFRSLRTEIEAQLQGIGMTADDAAKVAETAMAAMTDAVSGAIDTTAAKTQAFNTLNENLEAQFRDVGMSAEDASHAADEAMQSMTAAMSGAVDEATAKTEAFAVLYAELERQFSEIGMTAEEASQTAQDAMDGLDESITRAIDNAATQVEAAEMLKADLMSQFSEIGMSAEDASHATSAAMDAMTDAIAQAVNEADTQSLESVKARLQMQFQAIGMSAQQAAKVAEGAMRVITDAISGMTDNAGTHSEVFDALRAALQEQFQAIGMSAEEAARAADEAMRSMSDSVADAMEGVESDAQVLDVLKAAYQQIKDELDSMDDTQAREVLEGVARGFEEVIGEMEKTISEGEKLDSKFSDLSDVMVRLLGGTENYNKIIGNLPPAMKSVITGIQGMTTAAKAFIATPFGAALAAIVLALQAMRTWLNSSVEGQMRLAEVTGYFSGVLGQLKEVVITVGKWLVKAFDDPRQAVSDLWKAIKENFVNRLKAVGDMGAALGKILKSAFTFDFDAVKQGVKELGESFVQFGTGVDNLPEKMRDKVSSIGDAAKEQAEINRQRRELEIEESKWNIRRAELEKKMAEANAKMYNTSLAKTERQKALNDYKSYNEEILKAEEGFIDQRIALKEREMALTTNAIETENELRDLQAEKIRKQAEAAQRLAMLQRRSNAFNRGDTTPDLQAEENARLAAEESIASKTLELRRRNQEKEIDLMREGYAKEIAAATLAYEQELAELEQLAEEWRAAQGGILTDEQSAELADARRLATEKMQQANDRALDSMLKTYNDYTARKKAIDDRYNQDYEAAFKLYNEAATEDAKEQYASILKSIKTDWAKETFNLNIDTIDATSYKTVEAKMKAINKAYMQYLAALKEAGADEAQLAAIEQERVAITGRIATINAEIKTLEGKKMVAVDKGDTEEVKRLNAEIERLKKELDAIMATGADEEIKGIRQQFEEWAQNLSSDDIAGYLHNIANALGEIGEAAGNSSIRNAGEAISGIGDAISNIAQGAATGGWIGAVIAAVATIAKEVIEVVSENEKLKKAIRDAKLDKWVSDQQALMDTDSIFGEDQLARLDASRAVIKNATAELQSLYLDMYNQIDNVMARPFFSAYDEITLMGIFEAAEKAWDKGYKDLEAYIIRTQDRGGFANWLGISDKFDNLKDVIEGLGYEMYDQYGNINAEALQAILDTYDKLGEEDRQWMEEAIAYSEKYAEAMQNLSDYLQNLFGDVADTIADQFIDSFMRSGEAAMDFGALTSDVSRQMVKDLIKSMILEDVMNQYKDVFKAVITSNNYDSEEARSAAMLELFAQMGGQIENLQPYIQDLLLTYKQYIGDLGVETAPISGSRLQTASQDSIDLVNGQLNAVRTNMSAIANRVDSVLMQLAGIHDEVRDFHGDSNTKLDKLISNTSEGGSILRQLGLWIG